MVSIGYVNIPVRIWIPIVVTFLGRGKSQQIPSIVFLNKHLLKGVIGENGPQKGTTNSGDGGVP
jgi:hypothetical protein